MIRGCEINLIIIVRKVKHLIDVRERELDRSFEKVRLDNGINTFWYLGKGDFGIKKASIHFL